MRVKIKHNGGFALIEILVALAVLGVLIPPVIGVFTAASGSNHRSVRNTVALTVARDIMDRIKSGGISPAYQYREIEKYRDKHGVEIYVSGIGGGTENTLSLLRVYVAPELGMDPQTKGIMLASYAANVYIREIDTTQLYDPGSGGEADDQPPGPGDGDDPYKLWADYYEYAFGIEMMGSNPRPAVRVLPLILLDRVAGIETLRQAMEASYFILHKSKMPHPKHGCYISWVHLKNVVEQYYGFRLNPYDYKKYVPYKPYSQAVYFHEMHA